MKQQLTLFARTQFLIIALTCVWIGVTTTPAYTDSPLIAQRIDQISAAVSSSRGRMALLPGGQGVLIQAASIDQLPELINGCEITSLTMLLNYEGFRVQKGVLAKQIVKDTAYPELNAAGVITSWGDPNSGFVGSVTGDEPGFGVYHGPIAALMRRYLPHDTMDLTGSSFSALLRVLRSGRPLIVWTTTIFSAHVPWETWQTAHGPVRVTMYEHAVLLVGYDATSVYVNNPLGGTPEQRLPLSSFRASWIAMGRQAITVRQNR